MAHETAFHSQEDPTFKALLVVAHPDDESECAAVLYRITHELGGAVDQVVVTNGEAGNDMLAGRQQQIHAVCDRKLATTAKSPPASRLRASGHSCASRTFAVERSFAIHRHLPPQLVEEVFEEDHMVLRLLRFGRLDPHQRDDAFPVRSEIKVQDDPSEFWYNPLSWG